MAFQDPVGIYIHDVITEGWTKPGEHGERTPTGKEFWRVMRGSEGLALRAMYEVPRGALRPDGKQMTVSDIHINGEPITCGRQFAERITMCLNLQISDEPITWDISVNEHLAPLAPTR